MGDKRLSEILIRLFFITVAIGLPCVSAWQLQRRYETPFSLLTVGIFTYGVAFLAQIALTWLFDSALLQSPLFGSLFIGIIIAFTDTLARFFGFYKIAPAILYKPQALMVGIGHALPRMLFNGLLALLLILKPPADSQETLTTAALALETLAALMATSGLLGFSMALSWLILQTFLRNELIWTFQAGLFTAFVFGIEAMLTNSIENPEIIVILFWGIISLIAWRLLHSTQAPSDFVWRPTDETE